MGKIYVKFGYPISEEEQAFSFMRIEAKSNRELQQFFGVYQQAVEGRWRVFDATDGREELINYFAQQSLESCRGL